MGHGGKPWVSDFNDPNYIAGRKAMKTGKISLYYFMLFLKIPNEYRQKIINVLSIFCISMAAKSMLPW